MSRTIEKSRLQRARWVGDAGPTRSPKIWKGRPEWPPGILSIQPLVGQRLSPLCAAGNHLAAFEAEPVDRTDDEENNQREFEEWHTTQ